MYPVYDTNNYPHICFNIDRLDKTSPCCLHNRDRFYTGADRCLTSQRSRLEQTSQGHGKSQQKRTWSPDRAAIGAQLEGFRATIAAQHAAIIRKSTVVAPDLAQLA